MKISTKMTLTIAKVNSVRYDDKRIGKPDIRALYISKSAFDNDSYPKEIQVEVTSGDG